MLGTDAHGSPGTTPATSRPPCKVAPVNPFRRPGHRLRKGEQPAKVTEPGRGLCAADKPLPAPVSVWLSLSLPRAAALTRPVSPGFLGPTPLLRPSLSLQDLLPRLPSLPLSSSAGLSHQPLIWFLESPAPLSYPGAGPRRLEGKVHDSLILPGGGRGTACRCSRCTGGPELSLPECGSGCRGQQAAAPALASLPHLPPRSLCPGSRARPSRRGARPPSDRTALACGLLPAGPGACAHLA